MDKVKFTDISKKCGVSPTTISRYFNHPELLSQNTRNAIERAIQELNYTQNNLARMLSTGQSNLVGVIFPHLHLSFYTEILNQLVKHGQQKGWHFIVYTSPKTRDEELHLINDLLAYQIKGLILLSHVLSPEDIESLPVPVISIERIGGRFKQINNDNFTGGKLAGNLLIRNNCDVFLHINNDYQEDWPSFKRILGFELAVKGLPYEMYIENDFTDPYSPAASLSMEQLLNKITKKYGRKKIGVFCSNDDIARLFERYCIRSSIKIPQNIELIGYDNSTVSEYAVYPITSIAQNIPMMAQIAIESLENYIPCESIVPATLIERDSTSRPDCEETSRP